MAALYNRAPIGSDHVKRRARTAGTRLDMRAFDLHMASPVPDLLEDHKLRGVSSVTRSTSKSGVLLQAVQSSKDAS